MTIELWLPLVLILVGIAWLIWWTFGGDEHEDPNDFAVIPPRQLMSKVWGHIQCPHCDMIVCIHESGWHLDHDDPENDDFDELSEFVERHTSSHG